MNRLHVTGVVLLVSAIGLAVTACFSSEVIATSTPSYSPPESSVDVQRLLAEVAQTFENATSYQGRIESSNTTGTECTVQSHDFAWTESAHWTSTVTSGGLPSEIYYVNGIVYDRYGTDSEWEVSRSVTGTNSREVAELITAALNRVENPQLLEGEPSDKSETVLIGGTLAPGLDLLEGQSNETDVRVSIDPNTFDLLALDYYTWLGSSKCEITWRFSDYGVGYLPPTPTAPG